MNVRPTTVEQLRKLKACNLKRVKPKKEDNYELSRYDNAVINLRAKNLRNGGMNTRAQLTPRERDVRADPIGYAEYIRELESVDPELFDRRQDSNGEKKRYNTPYRGGKIAYKFGNSMDAKYVNRKQKTNTAKRKPATKRRATRVKRK